jgi:protein required for attachment to host cells
MKPLRTWVLIADGAKARILENRGPGDSLIEVDGLEFAADHAATHDLVADRQGRSFSSHGSGRSAIESRSDPHRELKAAFARHLAVVLARNLSDGRYHRLIVVAPPATMGDLRDEISGPVRAAIVGEVTRDLTKTPNHEVAAHLKDVLYAI